MLAADWLPVCYLESNHLFIIGSESSTTDNEADFFHAFVCQHELTNNQ